jgi:hypothetical protein
VRTFLFHFALTYIAAIFLASGAGHMFRVESFRQLIHEHRVLPSALAGLIAVGVCGFELLMASAALFSLQHSTTDFVQISVLVGAAVGGTAFWSYVRQLLREPSGVTSCGCSPLSAPLTPASLAPSIGLVCTSIGGLAAMSRASDPGYGLPIVLPCLWGGLLAAITALYPASVLQLTVTREA